MPKVIIIVNAEIQASGKLIPTSPTTQQMVAALRRGIETNSQEYVEIEVTSVATLNKLPQDSSSSFVEEIICPLTISLPDHYQFPAQQVYKACENIQGRRSWVSRKLNYGTGDSQDKGWLGDMWLPIVLTVEDAKYGDVIGEGGIPNFYQQPIDLPKLQINSLHHLAKELLKSIQALPAVYLLQFGIKRGKIIFDRLWPFPAAPAIASINNQGPNLFTRHWLCLTGKKID